MPANQSEKKQRFRKLAQLRTDAALDRVRILGNCANRSVYDYTDEEVNKIFFAIEEQLRIVKSKFKRPRRKFNF